MNEREVTDDKCVPDNLNKRVGKQLSKIITFGKAGIARAELSYQGSYVIEDNSNFESNAIPVKERIQAILRKKKGANKDQEESGRVPHT